MQPPFTGDISFVTSTTCVSQSVTRRSTATTRTRTVITAVALADIPNDLVMISASLAARRVRRECSLVRGASHARTAALSHVRRSPSSP
ncbi:MAG TPA: hypothetical protein VNU46_00465 [Gemmatimonadaceae bacterium]|nr:hypothetical protein [Gemmatimonadaceae bacterium]